MSADISTDGRHAGLTIMKKSASTIKAVCMWNFSPSSAAAMSSWVAIFHRFHCFAAFFRGSEKRRRGEIKSCTRDCLKILEIELHLTMWTRRFPWICMLNARDKQLIAIVSSLLRNWVVNLMRIDSWNHNNCEKSFESCRIANWPKRVSQHLTIKILQADWLVRFSPSTWRKLKKT